MKRHPFHNSKKKWNYTQTPFIIFLKIKLSLYWKCLFKRHLYTISIHNGKFQNLKRHSPQFPKNGIILKVSLEETHSIIFKKIRFILKVSLQMTLSTISIHGGKFQILKRHPPQLPKNGIILKVDLEETPSIIFKKLGLYWKCLFKRLSTISIHSGKFWIYAKTVSSRDTFHKRKK